METVLTLCTGGRDGALMLWDSREPARWDDETGSALSSPALAIQDAHKNQDTAAESARKRRRSVSHLLTLVALATLDQNVVLLSMI